VNPATVIPAVFIPMAVAIYRKNINLVGGLSIATSGFAFFVWHLVSNVYNDTSLYNGFSIDTLYSGLPKVIDGFLHSVNLLELLVLLFIILTGKVAFFSLKDEENYGFYKKPVILYATHMAILFSIGWLFLFSGNRWVEINQFYIRYFIYVIFSLIFILALHISLILKCVSVKKQTILTGLLAVFTASSVISTITESSISFNNFNVFKRVNALTQPGRHLYSGDYWVVWPSVLRDMMHGHEAYGLTIRGGGNNAEILEQFWGEDLDSDKEKLLKRLIKRKEERE